MTAEEQPEELVLTSAKAAEKALAFSRKPDPFSSDIAPSLLSAEHIDKYIREVGLVSPYHQGGGRKARLKKASYEGRIGSKAYKFDDNSDDLIPILVPDQPLKIPANSIIFVECDLEFRLPRYIGLRFNLQIRHVHRGLLLGTGPLVDPGYWGKLCIPLHNLTNEDYEIPVEEGLIWVEFTKTTSDSEIGRVTLTEGEEHSEHWEIEKFLRKAAKPLVEGRPSIGIRSSIPKMVSAATSEARSAVASSSTALAESKNARELSAKAEKTANDTRTLFFRIGWVGALVAAVALVTLWATFYFGLRNDINAVSGNVSNVSMGLTDLKSTNGSQIERLETLRAKQEDLLRRLELNEQEIYKLRRQVELNRAPPEPPSNPDNGASP